MFAGELWDLQSRKRDRACVRACVCVSSRVMAWAQNKHTLGAMTNYACGNNAPYNTPKKYEDSATN
jgi:hypothetical protein